MIDSRPSTFKLVLTGLEKLVADFQGNGLPQNGHVLVAKKYESFIKRRFKRYSRGSGNWKPHSPATIRQRKKGKGKMKGKGKPELLKDTGTVFKGLTIGAPGNLMEPIKGGVRFGITGRGRHPSGMRVSELALIHDQGLGRVPQRKIIVKPDEATERQLVATIKRVVERTIEDRSK